MKIAYVCGTRPQFIKAPLILKAIQNAGHEGTILITTQHHDECLTLDRQFTFQAFVGRTVGKQDLIVVEGDCRTTLEATTFARMWGKKIVHIEAGCRTYEDMPEEHIRVAVDHMSQYHLCAHKDHVVNLEKEGIFNAQVVGDIQIHLAQKMLVEVGEISPENKHGILLTIHREANATKEFVERVLRACGSLPISFPAHPRIKKLFEQSDPRFREPLSHADLLKSISQARIVITDSGGVQKEASALGKPVIVLRDKTEWPMLQPFLCPPDKVEILLPTAIQNTKAFPNVEKEFPQNPEEAMTKFFKGL